MDLPGVPGESTPTDLGPRAKSVLSLDARRLLAIHGLALPGEEGDNTTTTASDLVVECRAEHPALGQDFIAYAHVLEIMC